MDMFDAKRRDFHSMDKFTKPSKEHGFGGPNTAIPFDQNDKSKLAGYKRVISRDPKFESGGGDTFNTNYDTTWKAITRDIISKQANKKEYNPMYAKPTMAVVDAVEEGKILRFDQFCNESAEAGYNMFAEAEDDTMNPNLGDDDQLGNTEPDGDEEPEVDEEQLEQVVEEHKDQIKDLLDEIAEKFEIEKEEASNLLRAAIKKIIEEPEDDEESDEFGGKDDDESDDDKDKNEEEE